MKNIAYPLSLLVLLMVSPLSYAIPPYIGVSVGENLSFNNQSCLRVGKKVLRNDGFQKIVQYKNSATLFAAYRNRNPYRYKALVKCLSGSGVISVVVVANVAKNAKAKADKLRSRIQRQASTIKRAKTRGAQLDDEEDNDEVKTVKAFSLESPEDEEESSDTEEKRNVAQHWQHTLLERKTCLSRAEMSLRDSGFYKELGFDDDSVYGKNKANYNGKIRCVTSEGLLFFQVTGSHARTRNRLLNKLQRNF
ncbi:MAG: hypothetical protein DRR08_10675 [Candidatus Parabeggiatoa sp. nov. 2]|nr:MAG: hypothetical protein B6247_12670 [Beggiatoa sp. 4572_84]RKZ60698.1 MAG: hypothetical protein DRR08_10675 [Gammaproteobacteria bacterium]